MIDKITLLNMFIEIGCKNTELAAALASEMLYSGISTKLRAAHFAAQICHESNFLNSTVENLNYSEKGLLQIFPRYFNTQTAKVYARKPFAIASRVYANRMGNSDESSAEGWKYRGRSAIQLTGKSNYAKYSALLFNDDRLVDNPDLVLQPSISAKIACAYWNINNCNLHADRDNIRSITKIVNGGYNGLAHREAIYKQALRVL